MILTLRRCIYPWCIFSGTWIFKDREVKILKSIIDGAPVICNEPLVLFELSNMSTARTLLNELQLSISISTIVSIVKYFLGKKVLVDSLAIPEPLSYYVKSIACGADGVLMSVNIELPEDVNKIVLSDKYVVADFTELSIIKVKDIIDGVVISSFGNVVKLELLQEDKMPNIYRCKKCYVDVISFENLRKCSTCFNKLTPLFRSDEIPEYSFRELKFISQEFLKYMRKSSPELVFK
ncbi:MAG: hypothetical protein B6V02_01680 [Thermoprotei archaeon ex4572_64]|nr:MAG: hypothetical protein B6V02_01680 [Thermoprotei archaeon ex4572_64]